MRAPQLPGILRLLLLSGLAGDAAAQTAGDSLDRSAVRGGTTAPGPTRLALDDGAYRSAVADIYWRWLAATPCQASPWHPSTDSPLAFEASLRSLRSAFDRRLGPRGNQRAGEPLVRRPIAQTPRYVVEFVEHGGRLGRTRFRGYLVLPLGVERAPVVILVHGAGTLPRQALGWSFGGAEAIAYPDAPISRLAADLADAGYAVFLPWIRDDASDIWPNQPWVSLDRAGDLFRVKAGGSGLGLAVGQLESVVDLLVALPGIDAARIASAGWEEGADLAAVLAAVDERVSAVVRLMPPLDRPRWRASPQGVRANPAFMQVDCTFAEPEIAALIAPRPMLYDWSPTDATFQRHRFFVDTTVVDRARLYFAAKGAGGGVTLSGAPATGTSRVLRVIDWLDRVLQRPQRRIVPTGVVADLPTDREALAPSRDTVAFYMGSAIGLLGACPVPAIPEPPTTSLPLFMAAADRWRQAIARDLRVPAPLPRPPRIVTRDTIERTREFTLEWIVTEPTATGLPLMGLLAAPTRTSGAAPALLTFDGDFSAGEPFALPPGGRTSYLKGYARDAARDGVVVFAPTIPAWFGEAGATLLAVRNPSGPTGWGTLLGQVRAATDLLRSLPTVDTSRVTLQGISLAGFVALYGAALDTRVSTLVFSNPINTADSLFTDFTGSLLASWYAPICGTINIAQRWLIAPRRFIWENGVLDQNGYERRPQEAARDVQRVYRDLGLPGQFDLLRHGGGHEEAPLELKVLDPYYRRPR